MERQAGYLERQEFNNDELIQALVNALDFEPPAGRPPNTWRTAELVQLTGMSMKAVHLRLHALIDEGRARHIRVPHVAMNGTRTMVDAYQIDIGQAE